MIAETDNFPIKYSCSIFIFTTYEQNMLIYVTKFIYEYMPMHYRSI
jgi:hypothetical protein